MQHIPTDTIPPKATLTSNLGAVSTSENNSVFVILIEFDEAVQGFALESLTLASLPDNSGVISNFTIIEPWQVYSVQINCLADGLYTLTFSPDGVTDEAGNFALGERIQLKRDTSFAQPVKMWLEGEIGPITNAHVVTIVLDFYQPITGTARFSCWFVMGCNFQFHVENLFFFFQGLRWTIWSFTTLTQPRQ